MASQQCYIPNGTVIGETVSCQPDNEVSFCCSAADMCSTNGLCKGTGGGANNLWGRFSCTDPTWKSANCTRHCFDSTTDPDAALNSIWWLYQCSQTTYCCSYGNYFSPVANNYSCCNDPLRLFDAGPPNYLSGASFPVAQFPQTLTSSTATTSMSLSTTTSNATPTPSGNANTTGLTGGAEAGIAVGAALGAGVILGLGLYFWQKRKGSGQEGGVEGDKEEVHEVNGLDGSVEADSNVRSELEGRKEGLPPVELEGNVMRSDQIGS